MSQTATAAAVRPQSRVAAPRPGTRPAPPSLRVVAPPPQARSRAGLAVLCTGLMVAGLVALLLLNISLSHGSYELYRLQSERDSLAEQRQALDEQLAVAAAPQQLARRAGALGMVPAPGVAVVRLSDGRLVGAASPAPTPRPPTVAARSDR